MDDFERIEYWVEISAYDLDTAKAMLETKRYLYVGFMCHQSIEKILKAVYVKNVASTPPFSHALAEIAKKAGVLSSFSEQQLDLLDILQPLNIKARYPSYKEKIYQTLNEERCVELLAKTKELWSWIQQEFLKK